MVRPAMLVLSYYGLSTMSLTAEYERYLRLLEIDRVPTGLEGLQRIVDRHLIRGPFENVSKLLLLDAEGAGRTPTLPEFLDGIEQLDLGGTCYTNNPFLTGLLRALGYEADLLGADMDHPNVHTSVRVRIASVEYHVDVGYAAPFRRPMALDQLPQSIVLAGTRYVLDRDGDGRYAMAVFLREQKVHGYVVHGPPRPAEFFHPIIVDSFVPGRTFMSLLRIARFFDDGVVELKGQRLTSDRGGIHSETTLHCMEDLVSAMKDALVMPRCPIEKAVTVLERLTGQAFFPDS
jgi:arylamine N-acetyltransferase